MSLKQLDKTLPKYIADMPIGEEMSFEEIVGETGWSKLEDPTGTGREFRKAVSDGKYAGLTVLERKRPNNARIYVRIN